MRFNPRSPRGGATLQHRHAILRRTGFNPRSPRGGATLFSFIILFFWYMFQSTLPTRGSDQKLSPAPCARGGFQSTLPTRGSDRCRDIHPPNPDRFNPRSPRGGATVMPGYSTGSTGGFNPRSPRGGATQRVRGGSTAPKVSIHAPHEGERPC